MRLSTAVELAVNTKDFTYNEWCDLFLPPSPNKERARRASYQAHTILVRNNIIEDDVIFEVDP